MDRKTISKMVKASGVSAGEIILIHFWGEDEDKEIANSFMVAVAEMGATPVLLQQSRSINRDIFLVAKESCFNDKYFNLFDSFDAVLDVFAYRPVILGYEIAVGQFDLYRKYMAQLFSKLMNCKRFTQIRIPTIANAEESGLDPQEYIQRMERAYDVDYTAIYEACKQEKERFNGVKKVLLRTGKDCELSFELTDRVWHIDAGDGDLPCGEIYIAPVEDKTQGTVYFETFFLDEIRYEHVQLTIKDGRIIHSNQPEIVQYFEKQPQGNRVVCELGFGMNPNVTDLCGYTVLDEKMYGTFHIAVGANTMFGGTNEATDHIDFVGRGVIVIG
ncbi:MAG: aminopeptidase [Anaeroplasmataceae bacterium]|nr:aminopeptidase [Anaeroplasmataceae bacterium]MDE6414917.1 aminopeptidase [Anaeroplasmataceae bacterium]